MFPLAISAVSAVSAIGLGLDATLTSLRQRSGALRPCDFADVTEGYIGRVDAIEAHALPAALARFDCRNNRLADLALHADGFAEAVAAARDRFGPGRIAVVTGTSTSGILSAEDAYRARDPVTGALPPTFDFTHTQDLFSLAHYVRAALGLRGPAFTVSIACASSARTFLDAAHLIAGDLCDAVVVGGADSLCRITLRGFAALDLISARPCRPCDAERDGISIGEAAGFALLERPDRRIGRVKLALLGAGVTSDGYHMSAPDPEGAGALGAMRQALRSAGLRPDEIDYVNLHGTGTRANDAMEDRAVASVFGDGMACSSTKGWTGHMLGASGAIEAAIVALCIHNDLLPGCLGVTEIDPAFRGRVLVDNGAGRVRRVVSNSFGFGGVNCSLVLGDSP